MAEYAEIGYHVSMSSLSSFDDLLSELDAPSGTPGQEREDPLRTNCLKQLVDLSGRLEKVAQILDPSESKHPLFKQTIPAEQRSHLKQLVGELMRVQGELQKIEESLLADSAPPLNEPAQAKDEERPQEQTSPAAEPVSVSTSSTSDQTTSQKPVAELPTTVVEPEPIIPPLAQTQPTATEPKPPLKDESLEKEQQEFSAYKAQWEAAFTQDPSLRAAHPEVAAYYEQMEAYFREKEQHLQKATSLDTTT